MALCHFSITTLSKKGQPGSAGRVCNYLKREGEYDPARAIDYLNRTSAQTKDREDLRHTEIRHLPDWAQGDPKKFFLAAQAHERVDGRWATAIQITLPVELSHQQRVELLQDFLAATMRRHPTLAVIHEPTSRIGTPQPHAHILFSERALDGIERSEGRFFRKANLQHPERGGTAKDPFFGERRAPEKLRHAYCDITNVYLERAGVEARIDPRSLRAREIDRKPEQRVGPWRVQELEQIVQETRAQRDTAKEQAIARDAWELRKERLGITPDILQDTVAMLTVIHAQGRAGAPGKALNLPARQYPSLVVQERELQATRDYIALLDKELTEEQRYASLGLPRPMAEKLHTEAVLAARHQHGIPRDRLPVAIREVIAAQAAEHERLQRGIRKLHIFDRGKEGYGR
jgi:hypothetical protein